MADVAGKGDGGDDEAGGDEQADHGQRHPEHGPPAVRRRRGRRG
ncbi:hypothetical protein [Nocardioides zeae]